MIYKISLDDMITMHNNGCMFIIQNETHALYQHGDNETIPESITILETYNDSQLADLYSADEWQQPKEDS